MQSACMKEQQLMKISAAALSPGKISGILQKTVFITEAGLQEEKWPKSADIPSM